MDHCRQGAVILAYLLALMLQTDCAAAQQSCDEGRTSAGHCVNAPLATSARLSAVLSAQPKLSATAFPILPVQDAKFRYPNSLTSNPLRATPIGPIGPRGLIIVR